MAATVDDAALARLLRVFAKRDAQGARIYSDDEVRAFLPVLVLASRGAVNLEGPLGGVMRAFAQGLGITAQTPPAEVERRVQAHFEANPPSPRLLSDVKAALPETLLPTSGVDPKAAAKALGGAMAKTPVGHGEAPEGSTKASPLTRFSWKKTDDEER